MNTSHEIDTRRRKIQEQLEYRRKLKAERKDLAAEIKACDDQIEALVDEIKAAQAGGAVQETLPGIAP